MKVAPTEKRAKSVPSTLLKHKTFKASGVVTKRKGAAGVSLASKKAILVASNGQANVSSPPAFSKKMSPKKKGKGKMSPQKKGGTPSIVKRQSLTASLISNGTGQNSRTPKVNKIVAGPLANGATQNVESPKISAVKRKSLAVATPAQNKNSQVSLTSPKKTKLAEEKSASNDVKGEYPISAGTPAKDSVLPIATPGKSTHPIANRKSITGHSTPVVAAEPQVSTPVPQSSTNKKSRKRHMQSDNVPTVEEDSALSKQADRPPKTKKKKILKSAARIPSPERAPLYLGKSQQMKPGENPGQWKKGPKLSKGERRHQAMRKDRAQLLLKAGLTNPVWSTPEEKRAFMEARRVDLTTDSRYLDVKEAAEALLRLAEERMASESKKNLFDGESQPIHLQIHTFRVPNTPSRFLRFNLPYSALDKNSDVFLIMADPVKGRKRDTEQDVIVEDLRELLEKKGVKNIKEVIPFSYLRTQYSQYEMKRKLANSYDAILCDSRFSSHALSFLGKEFFGNQKNVTPVRLTNSENRKKITYVDDFQAAIDFALKKVAMKIHSNGTSFSVLVGNTHMTKGEIAHNVRVVFDELQVVFPGALNNVKLGMLKCRYCKPVPVFMSLRPHHEVAVPYVKPLNDKLGEPATGELSTLPGREVTVYPGGRLEVRNKMTPEDREFEKSMGQESKFTKTQRQLKAKQAQQTQRKNRWGVPPASENTESMVPKKENRNMKGQKLGQTKKFLPKKTFIPGKKFTPGMKSSPGKKFTPGKKNRQGEKMVQED